MLCIQIAKDHVVMPRSSRHFLHTTDVGLHVHGILSHISSGTLLLRRTICSRYSSESVVFLHYHVSLSSSYIIGCRLRYRIATTGFLLLLSFCASATKNLRCRRHSDSGFVRPWMSPWVCSSRKPCAYIKNQRTEFHPILVTYVHLDLWMYWLDLASKVKGQGHSRQWPGKRVNAVCSLLLELISPKLD